jgi:phenylalanyl-tRNA synthetase beta chain
MAFVETGRESGYATARSVMDSLLRELGWKAEYAPIEMGTFVTGRAASFSVGRQQVGILGEVHPEVLTNFGLTHPVALAEITLERVF